VFFNDANQAIGTYLNLHILLNLLYCKNNIMYLSRVKKLGRGPIMLSVYKIIFIIIIIRRPIYCPHTKFFLGDQLSTVYPCVITSYQQRMYENRLWIDTYIAREFTTGSRYHFASGFQQRILFYQNGIR